MPHNALEYLQQFGFRVKWQDATDVVIEHGKHDFAQRVPRKDLTPRRIRELHEQMLRHVSAKRGTPTKKQPSRPSLQARTLDAAQQRRDKQRARERELLANDRTFQFYDRLMRSVPGR